MRKNGLLFMLFSVIAVIAAGFLVITFLRWTQTSEQERARPVRPEQMAFNSSKQISEPDIEIQLTAKPKEVSILEDKHTDVWSYEGRLIRGDKSHLLKIPDTYLGPTITVRRGQKVRIHFKNDIPEKSVIHWHGLHVPEDMDGHPRYAIDPGQTYIYEFEVKNRAGTYLYHPHPHGVTGKQVYYGLAGLFIIEDDEEQALNLPSGEFDIPLVIQDRRFKEDGSLDYIQPSKHMGTMMETMWGFHGDVILVNGMPDYKVHVKTTQYRVRIANVSNARIYKLYLSNGSRVKVIGTDGGLLEAPAQRDYLVLSPGERADIIMDFSTHNVGDIVELRSMQFESGTMSMMGRGMMGRGMMGRGMMTPSGMLSGEDDLKIAEFKVVAEIKPARKIPVKLSKVEKPHLSDAINKNNPRQFRFSMGMMMQPTINGRTFEMDEVAPDEIVRLNTTEIWEITNSGHMPMPHPVHIHGLQFRIVDRTGSPSDLKHGYVDSGWKDTFLLMPGETVHVLLRFEDFTGMYLYHCHNLEHSDLGMMRNYKIIE